MEASYFTILKWFLPYIDMNQLWVYLCSPSWIPLLPPSPSYPSGSSQCTSPEHPVSCVEPGLAMYFTHGNIHVSMPVISNHPTLTFSQRVQKSVLYICVSFAVSHIGHCYHFSKFHIYALICCIGVFLSDLLTLYNRLQFHPPHQNWFKCILFNSWVIVHYVYISQLS